MPTSIKLWGENSACFHILQLSYGCFSLRYYSLELEIAGKNSKLLPLFCQNPLALQSFVMGKTEIETIKEKSQPRSVWSELICILNWNCLTGETLCKHKHCPVIPNTTSCSSSSSPSWLLPFPLFFFLFFLFLFWKRQKPRWEALQSHSVRQC